MFKNKHVDQLVEAKIALNRAEEQYNKIKENFGDRVKKFITFNEPSVFVGCGYQGGMHAPGLQLGTKDLLRIGHNILLSHGKAVKVLREIPDAKIGITLATQPKIPVSPAVPLL